MALAAPVSSCVLTCPCPSLPLQPRVQSGAALQRHRVPAPGGALRPHRLRGAGCAAAGGAGCSTLLLRSPLPRPPTRCAFLPPARPGVVTTLVTEAQLPALQAMAAELGIDVTPAPPPPPELPLGAEGEGEGSVDVETARQGLEDLFNLY